jgi:hypothetical protein
MDEFALLFPASLASHSVRLVLGLIHERGAD